VFAGPLLVYIAVLLHPTGLRVGRDDRLFLAIHLAFPLLICLLAWSLVMLVDGVDNRAATAVRVLVIPFAVAYTAFATFDGIAIGAFVLKANSLPADAQPAAAQLIHSVSNSELEWPLYLIASLVWLATALAVVVALRHRGRRRALRQEPRPPVGPGRDDRVPRRRGVGRAARGEHRRPHPRRRRPGRHAEETMSPNRGHNHQEVAMRTRLVFLLALLVAAATAGSALAHGSAKASPCSTGTITKTGSYVLALRIGPRQEMYMPSEVRERNIKKGQVMLGGAMAMIDRVPAGMRIYDLAVHVCTNSGAVVTQLKPTIAVKTAGAKPRPVAVAMMAAVGKGLSDYHYGNDDTLKPGSKVTVTVTFKGKTANGKTGDVYASFITTVPKQGSTGGSGMSMG
jgi:hypothetical protein